MLTTNHFAELSASVPPMVMQAFVAVMIFCVIAGTLFDVIHKGSAKYFFRAGKKAEDNAIRKVGGGAKMSMAVKTAASEVLTSSEFCNPGRRIAHLLGMYGFVIYVVATIVMVFSYPTATTGTPEIWPILWAIGALMVCVGGYWFWFFIRVDVAAEGNPTLRIVRADLFILSLLASATFGLIWAYLQYAGAGIWTYVFLGLYLASTALLFGGVPFSKFSHMFFKPAAAYQKRVGVANGSAQNLPTISRDDPEQQKRHSMELLRDAPMKMGLGIKREAPRHY